ncbi:sulfotransferase family protein [Methylobacterium iners]|uniref:Sulfotransferase family protein n=1 Tax=Methylobacterium iners TaxID=418707 RepID=A0ABQ4S0I5_9HYPH|nr:sulfotransferase family protein [Methylobacterium iners]GJD96638.1 hypothetical protein OCOJLMKI_3861 [Methylobacterium iners]
MIPERVVSLHFPKAGGSSLKIQLQEALGEQMVLDWGANPFSEYVEPTAVFPAGKRLVHGHFTAQRYSATDAFKFTFLRHPIDNLISIYFFWKNWPNFENVSVLHRFQRERPKLREFAQYDEMKNLMTKVFFNNYDMERFDFVGFHEDRMASFKRLSGELGLELDGSLHENRTKEDPEKLEIESDASLRADLSSILADDIRFYDKTRSLWSRL